MKMYGNSPSRVRKHLVPVAWLPNTFNHRIMITSVNGVNQKLQAVSRALDGLPENMNVISQIGKQC